ncbi:DNA-processing protein DprA [Streptomyces seoulensis]
MTTYDTEMIMPMAVAISGTRKTGHHELGWFGDLFDQYLTPWATPDAHFYIGGARGIDSLSLLWLAGNSSSKITIVVPGTLRQQPADARQAIARCRERISLIVELAAEELRTPAFHDRNRYMVDHAQMVIGFPLGDAAEGSGTWQTITYAAERGKPRLIVPI